MKFNDLQLSFGGEFEDLEDGEGEGGAISDAEARIISEASRQTFVDGKRPAWFAEYLHLIELGWPWRIACYMAWASSPKVGRWPVTLDDLAKEVLGLRGTRVIYTWRSKHPAINQVVAMLQAAPLWEHRREVIEALVTVASQPDYKGFNDRKLFLELTGDYVPRSVQAVMDNRSARDLSEMSDEELDAMLGGEDQKIEPLRNEENTRFNEGREAPALREGSALGDGDDWVAGEDWEDGEG